MDFIEQIAPLIQKYAPQYDIKVCSPIIAQAVLESAHGTSELAVNALNVFGLKKRAGRCPTSAGVYYKIGSEQNADGSYVSSAMQWEKFNSLEDCVIGYFDFTNISNYKCLKGVTDPKEYLTLIRDVCHYATSLKYVDNVYNVITKYNLTRFDTQETPAEPPKATELKINTSYPCNSANYGATRATSAIKYITIHATGNKTDLAVNNAKYFQTAGRGASAHYFVDDNDIYQSVKDTVVAWSVGGKKWNDCDATGGGKMYGIITNSNQLSVEMCGTNGAISEATIARTVLLVKQLMRKYSIPADNVYRHFSVNGKHCPIWSGWFGSNSSKWTDFKKRLTADQTPIVAPAVKEEPKTDSFLVKVIVPALNVRSGAGTDYPVKSCITSGGIFTIVETNKSWGRLKSGAGWININAKYCTRL